MPAGKFRQNPVESFSEQPEIHRHPNAAQGRRSCDNPGELLGMGKSEIECNQAAQTVPLENMRTCAAAEPKDAEEQADVFPVLVPVPDKTALSVASAVPAVIHAQTETPRTEHRSASLRYRPPCSPSPCRIATAPAPPPMGVQDW